MDRLDAPEVLRFEQIAYDTVCFHIKKPFGFLTGTITRYQVKWREQGKNEELHKIFDNPNTTKLEIGGLRNGVAYDFSFESGSRLRFGKPAYKKGVLLDNWSLELFTSKLKDSNAVIGRLNEWTDNTVKQMLEKVFGDDKSKLLGRRRSSIFSRLSSSVKFCSKPTKGIYIAFLVSHKNKIVLTGDKVVPMIRVDKSTSQIDEAFIKWFCRLPRHLQDLLAIQRIQDECLQNEAPSTSFSLEREVLKSLLALMMLTSYEKFDFYHYKTVKTEDASVLVVGARGQGVFVENFNWYSRSKQSPKCEIQEELLKIGQFYDSLRSSMKPGLYVADLRLVSDIQQIHVQTCRQDPAYLPCAFVRQNSHMNKKEWSWLRPNEVEYADNLSDSDQLNFYRQFFQAIDELFERYKLPIEQRPDYCICNDFLLEYGQISMVLIYPGHSNIVSFKGTDAKNPDNKTQLVPGSFFEREYLRHVSSGMLDKYSKIRAYLPIFKRALQMEKMQEKRVRTWSKSVGQNVMDAEKMLTKFESGISWLNSVVSKARKNENCVKLCQLQQQFELFEILSYSQSFAVRKAKLSKINVVINFSSLYPPKTAMLIQVKTETTATDIIQLILQRSFTKAQLSQMNENDFYLAVSCGMRERRLRSTLRLHELDEPWVDGEFCIRRCIPIPNQGNCSPTKSSSFIISNNNTNALHNVCK